jgi:hypothetical protein
MIIIMITLMYKNNIIKSGYNVKPSSPKPGNQQHKRHETSLKRRTILKTANPEPV